MSLFALVLSAVCLFGQTTGVSSAPFTVAITAPQLTVKLGDPIVIHIVLKSTTQGTLTLPEDRHAGSQGEMNYRIIVETARGNPVPDTESGAKYKSGAAVRHRSVLIMYLNYDEEVAEDADLNRVVKITSPGDYVVQVERADDLYSSLHIKSNKLVIHVEP